eukprot:2191256-Amphidinium_carterae.1
MAQEERNPAEALSSEACPTTTPEGHTRNAQDQEAKYAGSSLHRHARWTAILKGRKSQLTNRNTRTRLWSARHWAQQQGTRHDALHTHMRAARLIKYFSMFILQLAVILWRSSLDLHSFCCVHPCNPHKRGKLELPRELQKESSNAFANSFSYVFVFLLGLGLC